MDIKVNFQSSIRINNEIYFDPFRITEKGSAKYIFITHPHFDHFSIDDIKKIVTDKTKFFIPLSMKEEYQKHFKNPAIFVIPNEFYSAFGIDFETIPAYNVNKNFHKKEYNWVGYILNIKNKKVLVTGDTDITPELNKVKADIVLLPIGGYYTCNLNEAANFINDIKPKIVIPTHYGEIVGNSKIGDDFKALIDKDIKCELKL